MTVHLPPRGFVQLLHVNSLFGVEAMGVVHLDSDQHIDAFVSLIDNATNTPVIIPMMSKGTRLSVAAVTNLSGRFISSLLVSNESASAATVDIVARDPQGAVTGQMTGVTIPAGGFFYSADILTAVGVSDGYGTLEVRSTNGQPVSAISLVKNGLSSEGSVVAGREF
jgi:hypothetical protein